MPGAFSLASALVLLPLGCQGLVTVVPPSGAAPSHFRRSLLCHAADARGVAAAGARLRAASPELSVALGTERGTEGLNHNFTHIAVLSAPCAALLDAEAVQSYHAELLRLCRGAPLDVRFAAAEPWSRRAGTAQVRHLVLWRFDPSKVVEAKAQGRGDPVDIALAGYRRLPETMPGYFAHLETAKVTNDSAGTRSFPLNEDTVVLYSSFFSEEAQEAFADDDRRKSFKAEFVSPYLETEGSLVFDFSEETFV